MKRVWSIEIAAPRKCWTRSCRPARFYFDSRFEAELRPGGALRYATPDGKRSFIRGEVEEVSPPARFVHKFRFTDLAEPEQRVTFELEELDGGTRVTVRHEGLERAPKHGKRVTSGWTRILGNLKSWMETGALPLSTRLQFCAMKLLAPLMPKEVPSPTG